MDEVNIHVIGQAVQPGDRLLITFAGHLTAAQADRIQHAIRDKLGADAFLVAGTNGVMILPPDWQPAGDPDAPDKG